MIHQHREDIYDLAIDLVPLTHFAVLGIERRKIAKRNSLLSGNHMNSSVGVFFFSLFLSPMPFFPLSLSEERIRERSHATRTRLPECRHKHCGRAGVEPLPSR